MQKYYKIFLILIFLFNLTSIAKETKFFSSQNYLNANYRMFTKSEIDSITVLALKNSGVINEKKQLEKQGYRFIPSYSIGGMRLTDSALFITICFNKGINSLSTQIVYSTKYSKTQIIFFEAKIDSSGFLTNFLAYDIKSDGSRGDNKSSQMKMFWNCFLKSGQMVECMIRQLWG